MQIQEKKLSDWSDSTFDHLFQEMDTQTRINEEEQTAKLTDEETDSEDEPLIGSFS